MSEAPDFAEAIEAWRVWRVVEDADGQLSLGSIVLPTLWPSGEPLVATCLRTARMWRRLRGKGGHAAPEPGCECGIYATALDQLRHYVTGFSGWRSGVRVLGLVSLWGSVVECDRGFRASHAYPSRIFVPADAGDRSDHGSEGIVIGLWRYGIPVEMLPSRYADATRALAERPAA